ncbi:Xenobiotic-transporting_ATPase / Multidrug resistance-associated protein [Hexamita inflata]|uniref:Xenobiotic-transporting_ATPase / Multidrug resistance-associated protein n=1 Tax=Hexamita inflata TaxID=28002 RepID=A0ABP1HWK7_9EUKA
MDAGMVVEYDRPTTLLRKKGHFYMLCKNTGIDNFRRLKQMALAQERKCFPELGDIDGIDENFEDGAAIDPDQFDKKEEAKNETQNARNKITDALFEDSGEEMGEDEKEESDIQQQQNQSAEKIVQQNSEEKIVVQQQQQSTENVDKDDAESAGSVLQQDQDNDVVQNQAGMVLRKTSGGNDSENLNGDDNTAEDKKDDE